MPCLCNDRYDKLKCNPGAPYHLSERHQNPFVIPSTASFSRKPRSFRLTFDAAERNVELVWISIISTIRIADASVYLYFS